MLIVTFIVLIIIQIPNDLVPTYYSRFTSYQVSPCHVLYIPINITLLMCYQICYLVSRTHAFYILFSMPKNTITPLPVMRITFPFVFQNPSQASSPQGSPSSYSISQLVPLLCFLFVLHFFFFLIFWPHQVACGILVPQPGIEPVPPAVEAQSLNHRTAREVPVSCILNVFVFFHFPLMMSYSILL